MSLFFINLVQCLNENHFGSFILGLVSAFGQMSGNQHFEPSHRSTRQHYSTNFFMLITSSGLVIRNIHRTGVIILRGSISEVSIN